ANDTDADGNPLTITAINGVTLTPGTAQQINTPNGIVNIDAQGTITFTPNTGFTGQETFSYTISDGQGGTSTATGTINVSSAPNTSPVALDDSYNTAFNTPVALDPLANDTDADGNPLTITAINGVTLTPGTAQQIGTPNGVVNIDAQGTITFTPNTGFSGQETFSYTISDGQGGTSTATGTINVSSAPNTSPVASDDTYNTAFNTPVTLNPLANDTDADGNPLTITAINGVTLTPGTAQQINTPNGVVNIEAQGTITFTPNNGFTGQESFNYSISDGQGGTSSATLTITINGTDDLPVAVADVNSINEDAVSVSGNVRSNDTLGDGTAAEHVVSLNGNAVGSYGTLVLNADGTYTYSLDNANPLVQQLAPTETLTETYSYTLTDKDGDTSTATLTITITGTNDVPVITGDATGAVTEDATTPNLTDTGTLSIVDADGGQAVFQTTGITASASALGSLSITSAGAWTYTVANADVQYLAAGETKVETFTVLSADGTSHDIVITITGTNDVPVITGDATGAVTEDATT
ncbi:tandem-95 repeat protein, partial [Acinetobacter lwoffii]|uniref:Ig-like domain-containing protein n=2 Tax=Acinetobacter TaxID=469 RepID=UPI0021CDBD89